MKQWEQINILLIRRHIQREYSAGTQQNVEAPLNFCERNRMKKIFLSWGTLLPSSSSATQKHSRNQITTPTFATTNSVRSIKLRQPPLAIIKKQIILTKVPLLQNCSHSTILTRLKQSQHLQTAHNIVSVCKKRWIWYGKKQRRDPWIVEVAGSLAMRQRLIRHR